MKCPAVKFYFLKSYEQSLVKTFKAKRNVQKYAYLVLCFICYILYMGSLKKLPLILFKIVLKCL